jgi:hypothetical protein
MDKNEGVGRRAGRRALALALCASALLLASADARAAVVTPLGLVPAGGVAVLRIDWGAVRADARLREAVKGDEFERLLQRVGVRSGEVTEAVIFFDIASAGTPDTAMILKGRAPLRPAVAALRDAGWSEGSLRGYRVFDDGAGDSRLAGLRSGMLVVGTKGAVERVTDVESAAGKPQTADATFRKLLVQTVAPDYPVSLMFALPQEYQDAADVVVKAASVLLGFTSLGPLGSLVDAVGVARGVGFSFARRGDEVPVNLVAVMKDDGAASLVSGTFTLLKGAASLMPAREDEPPDARRARKMFESMSVVRRREVVSVRLTLPEFPAARR